MLRFLPGILTTGMMVLGAGMACGQQDYPNKPVRIYTSNPGGGTDFLSRIIAQGITGPLGQPVIVENRGGNIVILADQVAKMPPDGHSMLVWANGVWVAQFLQKVNYDAVKDLSPVTLAVVQPSILVVHPSLPVKTVKDLIALAKARAGELNYSSAGTGGTTHLHAELFNSMAGINMVRINYKSTGSGLIATLSGETQMMFPTANAAASHISSGKLKALAVTSAQPTALLPGLPTIAATLPGYEATAITGIFVPSKTPAAITNRLNQEIVRVLNRPDVKQQFFNAGVDVVASSQEQLAAAIRADMVRWAKVIKDTGIKGED